MSLGPCPECGYKVSSTADSCPSCGNRNFLVETGKVYMGVCDLCHGRGVIKAETIPVDPDAYTECPWCKKTGKRKYVELKDTRSGELYKQDVGLGFISKAW